tara:strand:+ start:1943 stop:2416 length:474 start_codon:yes stop_codon:yes gene_type:complete
MKIYTVHAPEGAAADAEDIKLVKEGFCWPALFIAPLWLLYRRQWLGMLAYVLGAMLISSMVYALGAGETMETLLSLLYSLLVAMHANDWRRWRLEVGGCRQIGVTAGRDLDEAEARWFGRWADPQTEVGDTSTAAALGIRQRPTSGLTPFATPFDPV